MSSDNEATESGEWVEIKPSSADVKLVMSYDNLRGSADYQSWHNRTIKALKYFGLWGYVTGDISVTDAPSRKAKDVFTHNEFKAYLFITSKLDSAVDNRVQSCKTASDLWKKLETQYKLKGSKGQTEIIYKWSRVKLAEGGNVGDYLAEHDEIKAQADELGLNFGDTYSALQLLLGLPPSWDGFRQTVETGAADREEELDFDHISELILQEDVRRFVNHRGSSRDGKKRSEKVNGEPDQVYSVPEKEAICYRCGYKGHFSFNCKTKPENYKPVVNASRQQYQQYPQTNRKPSYNTYNNDPGPSTPRAEAKVMRDEPLDFAGAYASTKAKRRVKAKDRDLRLLPRTTGDYPQRPKRTLHLTDVDVALMAGGEGDGTQEPFLIDSGASNHICGDKSLFANLRPHRASVSTADTTNPLVTVYEIGTLIFSTTTNRKATKFSLSDVYYIPDFCNLISVGQLMRKGVKVEINQDGMKLSTADGRHFARGEIYKKNLFKLEAYPAVESMCRAVQENGTDLAKLWHRRLGHVFKSYLTACIKSKALGITVNDVKQAFATPCITCVKGKKARDPFPESEQQASEALALLHSDLAGPLGDVTRGGARYWLPIIDDHSRYVWTYTLRSKSETVDVITSCIILAERSTGKKVKRFRTDNGGEYMKLDQILAESGIVRETTVAGTPQQNGRAERMNRTLGEKITCMLIDSGLEPSFWGEALAAATYVINRQPCKPIGMQTPHEKSYGRGPDMERLRVFGTACEVLILPKVKKLAPKTRTCILLGYAELKKCRYLTWCLYFSFRWSCMKRETRKEENRERTN